MLELAHSGRYQNAVYSMNGKRTRKWIVVAHFFSGSGDRWLDDFVDDEGLRFEKVAPPRKFRSWHARGSLVTPLSEWAAYLRQAMSATGRRPHGLIVCFPQLAMCAGLLTLVLRHDTKIIAYNFNLGALPGGARQHLARLVSRQINRFVVHSPLEVDSYAAYLGVPRSRITFVPLQRGMIHIPRNEETKEPYLLAMESANRDYATLIAAVDDLKIRTIIVTRPEAVKTLPSSPHVTFLSGLSQRHCDELMAGARISVTPVANQETASGQITFLTAMQLGVPVIATRCPGTVGYIKHGNTGLLVEAGDRPGLKAAIETLWTDAETRLSVADRARNEFAAQFSDSAAANSLHQIIRELEN